MSLTIRKVGPCFAGEVEGVDLTKPLSPEDAAAIHAGMDEFAVLVFRDQMLNDEQQMAYTLSLGPIERSTGTSLRKKEEYRLPTTFADVSNLDKENKPLARDDRRRLFGIGNRLWHSDSSFKTTPAKYSILNARSIPSKGGNTEFADMRAAYDALDDEMKAEVEGLVCEHSQLSSREQVGFTEFTEEERERFKPVRQVLRRTHPVTGRKSLYCSPRFTIGLKGIDEEEGDALLDELIAHSIKKEFRYRHHWSDSDVVMWDNRCVNHRATGGYEYPDIRHLYRTTVEGQATA